MLVHSPGSASSLNVQPVFDGKLEVVANVGAITDENNTRNEVSDKEKAGENEDAGSDAESKSVQSTTTMLTDVTEIVTENASANKENMTTRFSTKTDKPSNGEVIVAKTTAAITTITTNSTAASGNDARNRGQSINSVSSQSSNTRRDHRDTRPSSRISNVSFTSQIGMNEVYIPD